MTALLDAPPIAPARLAYLLVPLAVTFLVLRTARTGSGGRFAVAAARGLVQLLAVGFVLAPLFEVDSAGIVTGVMALICCLAALFSLGVVGRGPGLRLWPLAVLAILPVVLALVGFGLGLVVALTDVLEARYAITLAGMLAGNAMNATALAAERFLGAVGERRDEIEDRLLLGASGREATAPLVGAALRAAVTPSINSLMAVGLVSFPGMMTGQIMAGSDPLPAAYWQMMIMALWTTAATLSARVILHLLQGRLMAEHRIQDELAVGDRTDFRVEPYASASASGGEGLAFDERPPEALTRGFIGDPPGE